MAIWFDYFIVRPTPRGGFNFNLNNDRIITQIHLPDDSRILFIISLIATEAYRLHQLHIRHRAYIHPNVCRRACVNVNQNNSRK